MSLTSRATTPALCAAVLALAACAPEAVAPPTEPEELLPPVFAGLPGADQLPVGLPERLAEDMAPHWTRCGDQFVARTLRPDGAAEGWIIAEDVSFQVVESPVDGAVQQLGVDWQAGVNLISDSYRQYFGATVVGEDIDGRRIEQAGWTDQQPFTAPLPHWTVRRNHEGYFVEFRPAATDAGQWEARYQRADCQEIPPGLQAS
jgi:hypothetical protein